MDTKLKLETLRALLSVARAAAADLEHTLANAIEYEDAEANRIGNALHVLDDEGEQMTRARHEVNRCHGMTGAAIGAQAHLTTLATLIESMKSVNRCGAQR